jgi:ribosome biogenesis GTPase
VRAQHAGRLLHAAAGRRALAAVGDWVAIRTRAQERTATIEAILPRRTEFTRKAAGELTEAQVVAANIDVVFLVMGLDRDYNPRRLERYLVLARESRATPHVLLSKADLVDDVAAPLAEIAAVAPGVAVHAVSVRDGRGLAEVRAAIGPGRTGALLGSSGAGKSTLINAWLGEARLATKAVRASDSRGRHTTRHRQLVPLPGGGLLIDTPGMRELQLWAATETPDAGTAFDDIEALAAGCHFTDCRHQSEPRCAVRGAVEAGQLDPARLDSFHKLQDEARTLAARQDARERIQQRAQAKTIAKSLRQMYRSRDRE